jgi:protein phosphatase
MHEVKDSSDAGALPALKWSGLTDVGRYRKNNEDAFLALTVDGEEVRRLGKYGEASMASHDFIFAVSDGMGGANAGEFASSIAVEKITQMIPGCFRNAAGGMEIGCNDILQELFEQIHTAILKMGESYEELSGMGATLSLCWVRPEVLYFCHIGDSRIYHLPQGGGIRQLTQDHTHVGWMQFKGEINEREARGHPGRNALQQALGGATQMLHPSLGSVRFEAGDRFLLCSDGLVEGLWDKGMDRLIRNPLQNQPKDVAERLVCEAVATDGRDNTTALVFEVLPPDLLAE